MSFRLMAHRGASADAPDNSAKAFELALLQGADLIETDVRETADNVLVLEHDEEIAGAGVRQNGFKLLRELKLTLLTVIEALEMFGDKIPFCWEIKEGGLEHRLIKLVRCSVPASIWEETEFSSFDFETAVNCHQIAPANKVGWLVNSWNSANITKVKNARLPQICPPARLIIESPELMKQATSLGIGVRAWSVQNPEVINKLIKFGVYGASVNFPAEALASVKSEPFTEGKIIYKDDLIFIFTPKQPHISRTDGGHLVVEPLQPYSGIEDCPRALRYRLIDAVSAASGALLSLPQMQGGIVNVQDMGNWFERSFKYRTAKRLHFHIYGRAVAATKQPFGEALSFPKYKHRHTLKVAAFSAVEQIKLSREIALRMEIFVQP